MDFELCVRSLLLQWSSIKAGRLWNFADLLIQYTSVCHHVKSGQLMSCIFCHNFVDRYRVFS